MGQPSFPYQITYTALPHTLSVSPSSLSSVSWACGMLLHCFGSGEQSAWWGCPSLTRRFQVQPEATDSRGWIWTIFLVLSPFQNSFLGFVSGLEQRRWSESQQGGRTSPPGRTKYLLGNGFKVGVLSAVVDVKWNIQWKKMLCYSRSPHVESCRYITEPVCDSFSNLWSRDVIHACLILFVQTERCVWSSGAVQDHNLPQKKGKISLRLAQWRNHKVISLKSWLSVLFRSDRPRSLSEYMCNHLI